MTEEEMVYASVRAVVELDQDPEAEERGLRVMMQNCVGMRARYPTPHPLRSALSACIGALSKAVAVYAPYLPPVYGVKDGGDAAPPYLPPAYSIKDGDDAAPA